MKQSASATQPPHWLTPLAILSVLAAVVVLFGSWPLLGGELVMHLVIGRWSWEHGVPPQVDVFSYVTEGQAFMAHSWLAGMLFYLIERHAGTLGFMALRFAVISVALMCAVRTARLLNAPWESMLLVAPVVLAIMWGRLEFRPQLFTTAFLSLQLWLLLSVYLGYRAWSWLWVLPPLYACWINLHGGWPQGLMMLSAPAAAGVLMTIRQRWVSSELTNRLPRWHLALVMAVCVLALVLNPYGVRLIYFPMEMQAPWIRELGAEWRSPYDGLEGFMTNPGWRAIGGGRELPMQPIFLVYTTLLVSVLFVRLRRWRTADLVPITVMLLWLGMSTRHLRAVGDTVLMIGPLVAAELRFTWWQTKHGPWLLASSLLLAPTLLASVVTWGHDARVGWRWNAGVPTCVEAACTRLGLSGRVYSLAPTWVLWAFHPRVQVQHTWEFVAGTAPRWLSSHESVVGNSSGASPGTSPATFVRWHHVDIIHLPTRAGRVVPRLSDDGWGIVHVGDRHFMMVRAPTAFPTYRVIRPWENAPVTPANALEVLGEANRALRHCPDGATFAWAYKAAALRLLGRDQESLEAKLKIPAKLVIE